VRKRRVFLTVEGINIEGELYLPRERDRKTFPALCICHGIPSGKLPDPADKGYPLLAEMFCTVDFVTMIFNFRGTGFSGGDIDLSGWTRDLEAAINYLFTCPEVEDTSISVMGFSGGAAVSAYVASHNPKVTSVILCACPSELDFMGGKGEAKSWIDRFRQIGAIRDKNFPDSVDEWLGGFKLIRPIQWIDKISPRPLLIVHGEEDEVVEAKHAWSLFKKAREPKEIAIVRRGNHKLRLNEEAMGIAKEWLKQHFN
jgi:alpha/beta superfamily hydrolase